MRNLRPLELVQRTRKAARAKERLTAPVEAYTPAELREKFPGGFTRAHTKLEREILQLRTRARHALPKWKLLPNDFDEIVEEKLEKRLRKFELKVNSPARLIAREMFVSMEKDVYPVPFTWLQEQCLKDPMFRARGEFRAVFAYLLRMVCFSVRIHQCSNEPWGQEGAIGTAPCDHASAPARVYGIRSR